VWVTVPEQLSADLAWAIGKRVFLGLPPPAQAARLLAGLDGCDVLRELARRAGPTGGFRNESLAWSA